MKTFMGTARGWKWLLVIPVVALLSACGGAGTPNRSAPTLETGTVTIQIGWGQATASAGRTGQSAAYPTDIKTIRATVTVGTFTASQSGAASVWAASPQTMITPVGTGLLKLDALNGSGIVLWSSPTYTVSVAANATTQVEVWMVPVTPPANPLQSLQITPATASIVLGTTQHYIATGTFSDGSTADVTGSVMWNSGAPGIATVSASGLATGVALGTASINATMGSIPSNTAALTVIAAKITQVQVTPTTNTISASQTRQFTATGIFDNNTTQDVTADADTTWLSSDPAVAPIDATGLATGMLNDVATVCTNITATVNGVVSNKAVLCVVQTPLGSITITPPAASITAGTSRAFAAIGNYTDGSTRDLTQIVTWMSDSADVAIFGGPGIVIGVAPGTAHITASLAAMSSNTAATVTVLPTPLASIAVTPPYATIAAGTTQRYTATASYDDGSPMNVTASVSWGSSNTGIATISASGIATGVVPGTVSITATMGGVTSLPVSLTVSPAGVTGISVTPATATVLRCARQQYTATATLSDNSTQDLTSIASWISSATSVATVSSAGRAIGVTAGSANITASYGGMTSNAAGLTVTAPGNSRESEERRYCDNDDDDDDANHDGDHRDGEH